MVLRDRILFAGPNVIRCRPLHIRMVLLLMKRNMFLGLVHLGHIATATWHETLQVLRLLLGWNMGGINCFVLRVS